jgi:hypothetical protein
MGDESPTPLVMEFIRATEVVIPVHQARSHDEFGSPNLNFTIYAAMTIVLQMEGSGWPERHRRRSDLLRTCQRHQVGTARPNARSDRRKCSLVVRWMDESCPVERIGALAVCSAVREKFSCE